MGNAVTVEQEAFLRYLCAPERRFPSNLAARVDMFVKGFVACARRGSITQADLASGKGLQLVLQEYGQSVSITAACDLPPSPTVVASILTLELAGSPKPHEVLEGCLLLVEEATKAAIKSGAETVVPPQLLPIVLPVALAFARIIVAVIIRDVGSNAPSNDGAMSEALVRRLWLNSSDADVAFQFGREERAPNCGEDHNAWDRGASSNAPFSGRGAYSSRANTVVPRLMDACAHYITRVPLEFTNAELHVGCTKFLLTCGATALYHDPRFSRAAVDVLTEHLLAQDYLRSLVITLLERQSQAPLVSRPVLVCVPCATRPASGGGTVSPSPTSGSWLGGWIGSGSSEPMPETSPNTEMCSEQPFEPRPFSVGQILSAVSADLAQQLIFHQRQNGHNTAQEVIRSLGKEVPLSMERLGDSVARACHWRLPLLYTLVVDNPHFLGVVLRHGDPSMLISNLLFTVALTANLSNNDERPVKTVLTYNQQPSGSGSEGGWLSWLGYAGGTQPQPQQLSNQRPIVALSDKLRFHLAATILLVLSQDMTVNNNLWSGKWALADTQASGTPWVAQGYQKSPCLGTHWLLLVSRAISKSIVMRWFDAATTLTAAIQNAAPFFHHLEPHPSQRLAHLLSSTVKRLCRICTLVAAERLRQKTNQQTGVDAATADNFHPQDSVTAMQEIAVLVHVVCGISEGIVGAITVSDRRNHSLFYELLYNKPLLRLEPIEPAPGTIDGADPLSHFLPLVTTEMISDVAGEHRYSVLEALSPIQDVIEQVESELASVDVNNTPAAILELIKHVVDSQSVLVSRPTAGVAISANASMGSIPNQSVGRSPSISTSRMPHMSLPNCLEVAFVYEEGADCNGFFTPLVWAQQFGAMFEWEDGTYGYGQAGLHAHGEPAALPLMKLREHLPLPQTTPHV